MFENNVNIQKEISASCFVAALLYAVTESNRIEHIRVSDCALQRIIETGASGVSNISLDEQIAARNLYLIHQKTITDIVAGVDIINCQYIQDLHDMLMFGDSRFVNNQNEIGTWRKSPAKIGKEFMLSPTEIDTKMHELVNEWHNIGEITMFDIARFHIEFEKVHPFVDGNGRIGRLLMLAQVIESNIPWCVIEACNRDEYYTCLVDEDVLRLTKLLEKEQNIFTETYL